MLIRSVTFDIKERTRDLLKLFKEGNKSDFDKLSELRYQLIEERLLYYADVRFFRKKLRVAERIRKSASEPYRFYRFMVRYGCDCCLTRDIAEGAKFAHAMIGGFKKFNKLASIVNKISGESNMDDITQALGNLDELEKLLAKVATGGRVLVEARNAAGLAPNYCVPFPDASSWVDAVHDSGKPKTDKERRDPGYYGY